ncbi:MAG: hypothetical protein ACD_3C00145G0015 [uncultured bacterium (gcode 4)]|uniref:Zn-dependent metallo-hydrolase RNA specificity domain-containing protein n=1 Tax=uncultured bacterium (gcode 4) TaxID=1234023 RepID=K2GC63_9BACT|nr:MAG: hypothetical protein ACD_3C00145G0015 [uncultured bacterium (gcode 4)]
MSREVQNALPEWDIVSTQEISEAVVCEQTDALVNKVNKQVTELLDIKITLPWWSDGVTWSCTRIDIKRSWNDSKSIVIDLWIFQWQRETDFERNQVLPFSPASIDAMVFTHAHMDHCWRAPMMITWSNKITDGNIVTTSKKSFEWVAFTSHVWRDLLEIMLKDSVDVMKKEAEKRLRILEKQCLMLKEQASILSILYKTLKKQKLNDHDRKLKKQLLHNRDIRTNEAIQEVINKIEAQFRLAWIPDVKQLGGMFSNTKKLIESRIFYTADDVSKLLSMTKWTRFEKENQIVPWVKLVFHRAEHVFGSCIATLIVDDWKWWEITLGFSWDLWRFFDPLYLNKPDIPPFKYDFFQIESTYGWRQHAERKAEKAKLAVIINEAYDRKWKILFPCFMLQRLQDVANLLLEMQDEVDQFKKPLIPKDIKIFYDGGSTQLINNIYKSNDKDWVYKRLFEKWRLTYIWWWADEVPEAEVKTSKKEAKTTNLAIAHANSCIVLSPSWMYQWWAISKYNELLTDPNNIIIFPWYVSEWTAWRKIIDIAKTWEHMIHLPGGEWKVPVNAKVIQLGSMSSHADQYDIMHFLGELKFSDDALVHLNHWDKDAKEELAKEIIRKKIVKKENVVIAESWNKLSRKTKKWKTEKIVYTDKAWRKISPHKPIKRSNFEERARLDQAKLKIALRTIYPNESFHISWLQNDILGWKVHRDSYTQRQLDKSRHPLIREYKEAKYEELTQSILTEESVGELLQQDLLDEAVKLIEKENASEISVSISMKRISGSNIYYAMVSIDWSVVFQTNSGDFKKIKDELANSKIIPENVELDKRKTSYNIDKKEFEIGLQALKWAKAVKENLVTKEFIEIEYKKEWREFKWLVSYKWKAILKLGWTSKVQIQNLLIRLKVMEKDSKENERIYLTKDNIMAIEWLESAGKEIQEPEVVEVKNPKPKKHRTTETLPKSSKRYSWEKDSRRQKKIKAK